VFLLVIRSANCDIDGEHQVGCCSTTGKDLDPLGAGFPGRREDLLSRHGVNDHAASVRVFADKP
jgi:hypothetical protein